MQLNLPLSEDGIATRYGFARKYREIPGAIRGSRIRFADETYFWLDDFNFFIISYGGVRLSPLGASATIWPIVPAPDGR
jgi:hypothetical protein